jgi:demethylspheroidene O-methyltransferase
LACCGPCTTRCHPGGTLLVAEPMAGAPGRRSMGDAYFGIYLLAMGRGRPRTARELGSACCAPQDSRRA